MAERGIAVSYETVRRWVNHSLKSRIATIQHFYSGGHLKPLGSIRILRVAESVLRRVFD